MTILMQAAKSGSAQKIIALVDEFKADVKIANDVGLTALHFASTPEAARALVQRGADIEAQCFHGLKETPLLWAIERNDAAVVKELTALGADLEYRESSPLKFCIQHPYSNEKLFYKKEMEALLAGGASIDGVIGEPPLFYAAVLGHVEAVRFLCDSGADLSIKLKYKGDYKGPETVLATMIREQAERSMLYPNFDHYLKKDCQAVIEELRLRNAPMA